MRLFPHARVVIRSCLDREGLLERLAAEVRAPTRSVLGLAPAPSKTFEGHVTATGFQIHRVSDELLGIDDTPTLDGEVAPGDAGCEIRVEVSHPSPIFVLSTALGVIVSVGALRILSSTPPVAGALLLAAVFVVGYPRLRFRIQLNKAVRSLSAIANPGARAPHEYPLFPG